MKKNLVVLLVWLLFWNLICLAGNYSNEYQNAYRYAYTNWITTADTINKANMDWTLTRVAMAKMISQYAMNVLLLEPDTNKKCFFSDVTSSLDAQYDNWVTLACQLWLMWIWNDGNISKYFKPYEIVTRWQWATVFSRALSRANGDIVSEGTPFYKTHMNYLQSKWIIKSVINPSHNTNEKRWNAMVMLMRSAGENNGSDNIVEDNDNQRIEDIIKDYNWVILNWSELRPNNATDTDNINVTRSAGGYTTIKIDLTWGTMYVDDDYNFVLKIPSAGTIIKTLELWYDDYSKLVSFRTRWENWSHVYSISVYSRLDYLSKCKATDGSSRNLEINYQIWWGNNDYIFIRRTVDRNVDLRMNLFTNTDSLRELVEKKHCDCKSCRVESYDF